MNSNTGNGSVIVRRRWRKRVSNQLAAFAAIMLFASTQVTGPESSSQISSDAGTTIANISESADDPAGDGFQDAADNNPTPTSTNIVSKAPRKKRLSLFLLRR